MANKDISNGFRKLTGGNIDALNTVYATVALACEAIPNVLDGDGVNLRFGKVVQIGTESSKQTYWWKNGFSDGNLVEKQSELKTFERLIYDVRGTVSFNKATKVITWSESYLYNGAKLGYIKINAGSLDISSNIAIAGSTMVIVGIRAVASFLTGVPSATTIGSANMEVFTDIASNTVRFRDTDFIPLFYYNKTTGRFRTPFASDAIFDEFTQGNFPTKAEVGSSINDAIGDITLSSDTSIAGNLSENAGDLNQYKVWRENQLPFAAFAAEFTVKEAFSFSEIDIYAAHVSSFAQIGVNVIMRIYRGVTFTGNVPNYTNATLVASGSLTPTQYYSQVATGVDQAALEAIYKTKTVSFPLNNTINAIVNEKLFIAFSVNSEIPFQNSPSSLDTGNRIGLYAAAPLSSGKVTNTSAYWFRNAVGWDLLVLSGLPIIFKADLTLSKFVEENTKTSRADIFPKQRLNTEWFNRYPGILSFEKYGSFLSKYLDVRPNDRPLVTVLEGDSIMGHDWHTSQGNFQIWESPPSLTTACIGRLLWENMQGERAIMNRYDRPSVFTETGVFNSLNTDPAWNDSGYRSCWTRVSTSTNAATQFVLDSAHNVGSFIFRTEANGCSSVIVSIPEGNGKLQARLSPSDAWSEANGFVFSQNAATNTQSQKRLYFQKTSGTNTPVTIKASKNIADSSRFLYWGFEKALKWGYNVVINSGRGSHTFALLRNFITAEIVNYKPDLVIQELSLLNELNASNAAQIRNNMQDFIWGDRAGNTNTWNLKTVSNNWNDFKLFTILPGNSKGHFNTDGSWLVLPTVNCKAYEAYNSCKYLLQSKNDVAFIDWSTAILREIDSDPNFSNNYDAYFNSSITGLSYTNDGIHQNDKGTNIMAKNLVPIFDITS